MELAESVGKVIASAVALTATYSNFINAALELEKSQNKLISAAKLTGTSFSELNEITRNAQQQFALSITQSTEYAVSLSKLASKPKETDKVGEAIENLLKKTGNL